MGKDRRIFLGSSVGQQKQKSLWRPAGQSVASQTAWEHSGCFSFCTTSSAPHPSGILLSSETRSCFSSCSSFLPDFEIFAETQGKPLVVGAVKPLTREGVRICCKVAEEQSPDFRTVAQRWMKLHDLDEFGGKRCFELELPWHY